MTRNLPECTAVAVTETLAADGFKISSPAGRFHDRTEGVYANDLPMMPERVAVYFWPHDSFDRLGSAVATTLRVAGYQAEHVTDFPGDYLVAWTEGDF